jgi:hypothetical protein
MHEKMTVNHTAGGGKAKKPKLDMTVYISTDPKGALEMLEKRRRKLGNTGLTGEREQFIELFFDALDISEDLLVLAKKLMTDLETGRRRGARAMKRKNPSALPRRPIHHDTAAP